MRKESKNGGEDRLARGRTSSRPVACSARPRILYVTTHWPHTAGTAAHLRSLNLLRALQQTGTVEVVILHHENTDGQGTPQADSELRLLCTLEVESRLNKTFIDKVRWTLDPRKDYPEGCGVGVDAMHRVRCRLSESDLIWFFKLRGADTFPNASWPCSVMDD
jgi:hypothetical protein